MRSVADHGSRRCIHGLSLSLIDTPKRVWQWLRASSPDTRLFAIGFVLLLPLFWAPLFVTRLLPGLDLPFHLGIADMLSKSGANSPYAPYYDGGLRMAPYAAHYIALVALGKLMNLLAAHKMVVAIYVASMPLAASSLLAACGRSRVPALLAFPLAYNLTLHYGFVSFALSLPVLMLLLAQMARYVQAESRQVVRTWFFAAALAFLLFLCHLQNFLFGVGAALSFAVFTRIPWRRRLLGAAALVPALGALAYWQLTATTNGPSRTIRQVWDIIKQQRSVDLAGRTFIQDVGRRLAGIHNHAMRAFTDMVEVKFCGWLLIVMATYLLLALAAWKLVDKSAQPSTAAKTRSFWLPSLVAVLGALAAFLLLPHHLPQLELMTFYPRFAVLVLLMALLLIPGRLRHLRAPWRWLLPVPALVLCALYGRQLVAHYRLYAAETADFLEVMDKTPPGARVLSLVFNRTSRVMRIESAYVGMSGFYPALRPHPNSMVNVWYCGMRHMPCQPKPTTGDFPKPWEPQRFNAEKNLPVFEYYFVRDLPPGLDLFKGESGKVEIFAHKGSWIVFRRRPG
jgi:hypothetical protein